MVYRKLPRAVFAGHHRHSGSNLVNRSVLSLHGWIVHTCTSIRVSSRTSFRLFLGVPAAFSRKLLRIQEIKFTALHSDTTTNLVERHTPLHPVYQRVSVKRRVSRKLLYREILGFHRSSRSFRRWLPWKRSRCIPVERSSTRQNHQDPSCRLVDLPERIIERIRKKIESPNPVHSDGLLRIGHCPQAWVRSAQLGAVPSSA